MSRKLNWDRNLGVNDTGVKKVVRDLVGRGTKNTDTKIIIGEINKNINEDTINQSFENTQVIDNNYIVNNIVDQAVNNITNDQVNRIVNNIVINEDNNIDNTDSNLLENTVANQSNNNTIDEQTSNPTLVLTEPLTKNITDVKEEELVNNNDTETKTTLVKTIRKKKQLLSKTISTNQPSNKVIASLVAMGQWHTESEQKVYEVMYQETIAHRRKERYFSAQGLCDKTGIASQITVRSAINGLIEKKSIEIISQKKGGKLAVRYKVYSPTEIIIRRRQSKIKIDEQSKEIYNY